MSYDDKKKEWENYCAEQLAELTPELADMGFVLEEKQPHLGGERYLMQAVTTMSGRKLILLGRCIKDNSRVVIKATKDRGGIRELEHDRLCRTTLKRIDFAHQAFLSPEEIAYTSRKGFMISIQVFIEQEKSFLERPIEEQFHLALRSFEAQESAHATAYHHVRLIKKTFGSMDAKGYVAAFKTFEHNIHTHRATDSQLRMLLKKSAELLVANDEVIERYSGFLTHTDFVPHNFRIADENIYLLDHSSLRFGNKYDGWARFVNFMTLYHPALEKALVQYVRDNRTKEESISLRMMRLYHLGEIIWYYVDKLPKSGGNLRKLNELRVIFWTDVLRSVLADTEVPQKIIDTYTSARDSLRSEDEKERQKGLH